jgi:hypothetical protein
MSANLYMKSYFLAAYKISKKLQRFVDQKLREPYVN